LTTNDVGALDVGGTHVTAARVILGSATLERRVRVQLHASSSGSELVAAIAGAATEAELPGAGPIGVAMPGPFDYDAGVSRISHKLTGLYGVDLRRELANALGVAPPAITFLNDAHAFLLGEWWAGAARGHDRAVGVTLGTGLGSAFLADGRLVDSGPDVPLGGEVYRLEYGSAPVEDTISRGALLERYAARSEPRLDVEQIADRARAGEPRAKAAFVDLGTSLAEFLTPLLQTFAPTCLVVGGSIAHAWDLLGPPVKRALLVDGMTISRADRIDDAPLLGAARFVASN
jgi:glucokinase